MNEVDALSFYYRIINNYFSTCQQPSNKLILDAIDLWKSKTNSLVDLNAYVYQTIYSPYFYIEEPYWKWFYDNPLTEKYLSKFIDRIDKIAEWNVSLIEFEIKVCSEEFGIKTSNIIHPSRWIITGMSVGPSFYHIAEIIGKDEFVKRHEIILNNGAEFVFTNRFTVKDSYEMINYYYFVNKINQILENKE